jgi:hypothetical protein
VKIYDFGLWFEQGGRWYTTIPQDGWFFIYYDGNLIATQLLEYALARDRRYPYIIKLNNNFRRNNFGHDIIGRPLSLDDFEIVENPEYPGDK